MARRTLPHALTLAVLAAAAGLVLGAAVAGGAPVVKRPPWLVLAQECLTPAEEQKLVGFRASDGTRLAGVVLGRGRTGIVLVHGSRSSFCEWIGYARHLARTARVIALDLRGSGSSYPAPREADVSRYERDVLAATAELRRRGSTRIFTVGSSQGAGVVLIAAPLQKLAGVVALSAPASTGWFDTVGAVRRSKVPVLFAASRNDRNFGPDARALYAASRSAHKRLLVVAGAGHGSGLLEERKPAAAVRAFLANPRG